MMSSRAYVAHDRAVSAARMYVQMALVGFFLALVIYVSVMAAFLSYYIAAPVPELRFAGGKPRLSVNPRSPRLPILSLLKYYVSLNLKNYISVQVGSKRLGGLDKREVVEPELQRFFQRREVPRETYRKGIRWITRGRVEQLRWAFPVSLLFFPLFALVYFVVFSQVNRWSSKTRFVRGADLVPFKRMKAALDKAVEEEKEDNPLLVPLVLGKLSLPDSVSRRHILVLGTTGAGKSICLNNYLTTLKYRRAYATEITKCVVYDTKGEFCSKHFEEDDLIYYPFDQRSIPWSFFNEVRDYPDLDVLSTSLYDAPKDCKDPYWYKAARDIFRTGLFYLLREDRTSNRDIWEFFSHPLHYIKDVLYTLPVRELGAVKHIDRADSQQASSVISILQERLTFFRYLTDRDGPFSFRSFIQDEADRRNLFLMNIRHYEAIFRPLMTFVIDIMTREVLSLADSFNRRITFVVDEFGSLDKMSCIFDFLTMGRSKGGFLVLANQDLGSVSAIYGTDKKETFFNNFNVHLVFRLNDPTTSEFLSKAFGEREVIKKFQSSQFSPSDLGDRFSMSEQEKLEKIVLPTEIENLRDLDSYLKIANYGLTRMRTPGNILSKLNAEFLQRDFGLKKMLQERPAAPPSGQAAQPVQSTA
jgi:type IV secretory pathway TraG/TraD family ATPase VirD4